ncbi:MAG TPA: EAL domain-containing protein [Spirochaetales bacterium]|nr:EAL domain-containing protein [Spirochaetales bacterium]
MSREGEKGLCRRILEAANDGVIVTDPDGAILEANPAFLAMTGYGMDEVAGKNARILNSGRHDAEFYQSLWAEVRSAGAWTGEIWNRRKSGEIYPCRVKIQAVPDEAGEASGFIGIFSDLSPLKDSEERLRNAVLFDPLTGLPNRSLFRDRLAQILDRARKKATRAALVFVDLDRFKHINESLGYQAGDELLREAARRLTERTGEAGTVCRLGGDEFAVILDSVQRSEDAGAAAAGILAALSAGFPMGPSEVHTGASAGIAVFPFDGTDAGALEKKAEAAMYEAKEAGRGRYRFASGKVGHTSRRQLELESRLRRALERGEFYLTYQPQAATGGVVPGTGAGLMGAEALIRWKPEGADTVSPGDFMDIAESTGLIVPMGEWALKTACADAKLWNDLGRPLTVSVNVSPRQFQAGTLARVTREALDASGLDPGRLKLEITETLLMDDMGETVTVMNEIRDMGVRFAVDDFGIGFSSLRYLDQLPVDVLKIDKAFIDPITDRYEGAQIATAVIALARSFEMISVAEGVETAEQLEALRMRGCDEIQGYLVSKPLDARAFRAFAFPAGGAGRPDPDPSA